MMLNNGVYILSWNARDDYNNNNNNRYICKKQVVRNTFFRTH